MAHVSPPESSARVSRLESYMSSKVSRLYAAVPFKPHGVCGRYETVFVIATGGVIGLWEQN